MGLSLDGPPELHDAHRRTAAGAATHVRVERAFRLLRRHGVFCNGGCPKDRIVPDPAGAGRLNHLCPAYKRFFSHSRPGLERLAAHLRTGRPLRSFAAEDRS